MSWGGGLPCKRHPFVGSVVLRASCTSWAVIFPLAEISDAMLWEKPLPIAELVPELGIFETEELAALYLRPGLQQLSKGDFHRIVEAGGKC